MADVERFVRESDVKPTCECATRKCGPHRCWPSRVGWTFLGVVFLYAITMHSFYQTSEQTLTKAFQETFQLRLDQTLTERMGRQQTEGVDRMVLAAQVKLQPTLDYITQSMESLHKAQSLSWVLTTPQVTREMEILRRLDILETRR